MKIKTFSSADEGSSVKNFDEAVNQWMAEHKNDQIVNMFHRSVASLELVEVVITIIYRELVTPATETTPAVYE